MTELKVSDLATKIEQAYEAATGEPLVLKPCQDRAGFNIFLPKGTEMVSRVGVVSFEILRQCLAAGSPTAAVRAVTDAINAHA